MKLTRIGDYAVRGVLYLAMQPEGKLSVLGDICSAYSISKTFMAKIIQLLSKAGIVKSFRGYKGGVMLARPSKEITLLDVIEAVEGPITLNDCVDENICKHKHACSVQPVWQELQNSFRKTLTHYTIDFLAQEERGFFELKKRE